MPATSGQTPTAPSPRRASPADRLAAGVVAIGALALLAVSAWLSPSPDGHGTHIALTGQACTWVMLFDQPCMTCGMTTAFAHAAEGDLAASFVTQPMGMVLAVMTSTLFWLAAHVALFGSRIGAMAPLLLRGRPLLLFVAALLAAWVYKLLAWDPT